MEKILLVEDDKTLSEGIAYSLKNEGYNVDIANTYFDGLKFIGFVTVIALISCINIINTISTNILLRKREISMIKAVGMTQSSIKRMIALEGVLYGIYAAIIGGIIGTGLSYILYKLVIGLSDFAWTIPWNHILVASIGGIIIALLSGIYPLKRINEGIIVENMRVEE